MNLPFVSIIIPAKNSARFVDEIIPSLINLNYPKNKYEVLITIDKLDKEDTYGEIEKYKNKAIKVFKTNKVGSGALRNMAITKASKKAKYFAFTDSDCIVDKNWLTNLIKTIEKSPKEIGCVGGVNLVPDNDNDFAKVTGALEQTFFGGGGSAQSTIRKKESYVNSIPTCDALYRKDIWVKEKQDENLIVGQDGELNYRLRKKGYKFLINPKAKVWHHRTNNLKWFIKRMFKYGEATAKITKKHGFDILKERFYALFTAAFLIYVLLVLVSWTFIPVNVYLWFLIPLGLYLLGALFSTVEVLFRSKKILGLITIILLFLQHTVYGWGLVTGFIKK